MKVYKAVDCETLKPGVWYTVKNGQWVEVQ